MSSRFLLKSIVFILPFMQLAHAAVLPGQQNKQELDRLERQSNQFLIEEAKRTEELLQKQRELRGSEAEGALPADSTWKFKIDNIVILNDDRFDSAPQREEIIQRYVGKELSKAESFALVKELTDFYISRGYATTLISVEPGNIKSGSVTLRGLWGKINDFKVNGVEPSFRERTRLFTAYPFAKGKVLNMQDIDQSVDNLLRVSSADNIQVEPSVINGFSDLNLLHSPSLPVSVSAGLNNSGSKAEGWQQYFSSFTGKNIAGLNDIFNAYYSWNNLNNPADKQDSWSLSYGIPLGYWGFDVNYYKSQYTKNIDGGYDTYVSDGNSARASLRLSRMLVRGATGKTSAWVKVERRDNYNAIENSQIDVSTKKYSSLATGVTYVGALGGGWVYGDIGVTSGMPWFGAAWKGDPDLNGFDLNYVKYNGILSWTRSLAKFGRLGMTYELNSGFQYSPDVLVSDAKVSIGDEYTVRGFKDDNVTSDSGAWLANTLQFPFDVGVAGVYQLTPYMGYDLGFTKDNCPEGVNTCDGQILMGASVGIKASGKYFSSSVVAGWPIRKPD